MNNEPVAWMGTIHGVKTYFKSVDGIDFEGMIPLYTHPVKEPAKQRYDKCMENEKEPNPIERLRFFLSCALSGQDWLDVEPFIDAITHPVKEQIPNAYGFTAPLTGVTTVSYPVKELTDEEILKEAENYGMNEKFIQDAPLFHAIKFAKAILRKAQKK